MLIRFTVENFLSFKDKQSFSLIPGKGTLKSHHKTSPIKGVTVLKTAVLFGANASGKSNFVKSIEFAKDLVVDGVKANQPIVYNYFKLDNDNINKPTLFEFEIQHKGQNYAYGFIFNSSQIIEEWLYIISKKSETKVFSRDNSGNEKFDLTYLLKRNTKKNEQDFLNFLALGTRDNQLLINEMSNRKVKENVTNIEDVFNVLDWFQNSLNVFFPSTKNDIKKFEFLNNTDLKKLFSEMLKYFDTGIDGVDFIPIDISRVEIPQIIFDDIKNNLLNVKSQKTVAFLANSQNDQYYTFSKTTKGILEAKILKTKHISASGVEILFDINEESDGTRRIMDLIPLIFDFLKGNNVFIVDELERSLHPNLVYEIMNFLLQKSENINSQIILSSHSTVLLSQTLLRKDEIWFIAKDSNGSSKFHSLEDYNIRFDKEVRKAYLLGRYKAVPNFGNIDNIQTLPFNLKN